MIMPRVGSQITLQTKQAARALCGSAITLAALIVPLNSAAAQSPANTEPPKTDAASSLRSILQEAVDQGLLETQSTSPIGVQSAPTAAKSSPKAAEPKVAAESCEITALADVTAYNEIESFEAITAAKAQLSHTDRTPADIRAVTMTYLALGLGTESLELSERTNEDFIALLSRIVEGEISPRDLDVIQNVVSCQASLKVWELAAAILLHDTDTPIRVMSPEIFNLLDKFPPQLRELLEIDFAIYAAQTGDILTAKRLLTKHAPETKRGEVPERKEENLLFLYGLVLQSKNDARSAEIFAHIGAGMGQFKTQAMKALADDALTTGRALPDAYESDLTAINHQYGDAQEAKLAAIELVKFRLGQDQYRDAINTAKTKFNDTEVMRLESVSLIGDKLSREFASEHNSRRLYALNGYFHDPDFFDSYPEIVKLVLQAHDTAVDLSLPELAYQLTPRLKSFQESGSDQSILNSLLFAQATLAYKSAQYDEAVSILKGVKDNAPADKLRKQAALASGSRALAQSVLAGLPASQERDEAYLEFVLQKGLWAESKMQAKTIAAKDKLSAKTQARSRDDGDKETAAESSMPFAFSLEFLDYLTAPIAADINPKFPDNSAELEALLLTLKSNTNVAKGFLNYDSSSP